MKENEMCLSKKNSLRSLSGISGILVILIGFIILMGWLANIPILTTPNIDYEPTSLPTSLCFVLTGIAIILLQKENCSPQYKRIAQILSLVVLLIGLFTLLDYTFNFFTGISLVGIGFENLKIFRMSIIAALSFILTGAAILLIDNRNFRCNYSQYFMLIVFFMMYLILLGFIYQTEIYTIDNDVHPAIYGVITFILITLGILSLRPDRGIVELLTSKRLGGSFGYKILLAIVIIPIIVGGLRLLGELLGLYGLRFGAALMTFTVTAILFLITMLSTISIDNIDVKRRKAENELKKAHDHLEEQVKERTAELKRAYKSLEASENQFRTLTENSIDIIIRFGTDLKIQYSNRDSKTLGLSEKDLIGKSVNELGISKDVEKLWNSNLQKALKTGDIQSFEYNLPENEEMRIFSSYVIPEICNGKVRSLIAVSRNITKRKKVEEQLKQTIRELERSNEELQSFAYITSHDLQEPLRTMGSYAGLLKRRYKGKFDQDADDFLDFMVDSAKRMKDMIQGLLDYSRVGTQGGKFRKFSSEEALSTALSNLHSSIEECQAEVTHDNLPEIFADRDQITRVFQNLIGNALKFRREEITPKIHISAKKEGNEYIFSVSDNGIGIEEQYTERIFEVFKRLHAIGEYQGAGIGLAIVKRIIDCHGGHIWVESEPGNGSTFYFTIQTDE